MPGPYPRSATAEQNAPTAIARFFAPADRRSNPQTYAAAAISGCMTGRHGTAKAAVRPSPGGLSRTENSIIIIDLSPENFGLTCDYMVTY